MEPEAKLSVSATTRSPRLGERHGRDYWFFSRERFEKGIRRGEFFEHAQILNQRYGTPRAPIEKALKAGKDVFLGVDIQGARQIRRSNFPVSTIFLLPPSFSVLKERLKGRGTETPQQIKARLRLARRELAEMKYYDYAVVNDSLPDAVEAVRAILKAEHCRVKDRGGT